MVRKIVMKDVVCESPGTAAITSGSIRVFDFKEFTITLEHDGAGGTAYLEAKSDQATLWAKLENSEITLTEDSVDVADGWECSTDLPNVRVVTTGAAVINNIILTTKE